ncbi:MAG: hypothetical protein ACI4R8_02935 [Candidatus Caccovivens sp.]
MKRKFGALLLCLMMCLSVFTGCSLVERNDKNYYEATVATISYTNGQTENITKRELLTAYNSYGYNYVDNYGYTREKAIEETLNSIVNNRLTLMAVENYYKENPSEGEMLNGNEQSYIWDKTYDALYSNLKSYFEDAVEGTTPNEVEAEKSLYTPFDKQVYLDEELNLRKTTPATTVREDYDGLRNGVYYNYELVEDGVQTYRELMYNKLVPNAENLDEQSYRAWKNALNKYLADVRKNYSYMDLKDDKKCFLFEMDRVYKILKDNYVVEKYSVIFNEQNHQGVDISNITASDVLAYYSAKVREDYTKYYVQNDVSSYASAMLSNIGDVDYILEGKDASQYFYVASIKIGLTEDQKTELKDYQSQRDAGTITATRYEELEAQIYASASVTVRDSKTGKETEKTISASNLLQMIKDDVNKPSFTAEEKAEAFRQYLYLYNSDDALKGADYNTVFGLNSSNEVLANSTFSEMTDVKDAIKALYNNGDAQIGDMTELVKTDDGYYIFFYAGKIGNLFAVNENFEASSDLEKIRILSSTKLNIFSNKTLLDKIYSEMSSDNFSVFENMNMNYLWNNYTSKVEYIENNLKDLY